MRRRRPADLTQRFEAFFGARRYGQLASNLPRPTLSARLRSMVDRDRAVCGRSQWLGGVLQQQRLPYERGGRTWTTVQDYFRQMAARMPHPR
jgi:hypothetical protein